jgi:hypothetical protein
VVEPVLGRYRPVDESDTEPLSGALPVAKVLGGLPYREVRAGGEELNHARTPSKVLVTGPPTQ